MLQVGIAESMTTHDMAQSAIELENSGEQAIALAESCLRTGNYAAAFLQYLPVLKALPHKKQGKSAYTSRSCPGVLIKCWT